MFYSKFLAAVILENIQTMAAHGDGRTEHPACIREGREPQTRSALRHRNAPRWPLCSRTSCRRTGPNFLL